MEIFPKQSLIANNDTHKDVLPRAPFKESIATQLQGVQSAVSSQLSGNLWSTSTAESHLP